MVPKPNEFQIQVFAAGDDGSGEETLLAALQWAELVRDVLTGRLYPPPSLLLCYRIQ